MEAGISDQMWSLEEVPALAAESRTVYPVATAMIGPHDEPPEVPPDREREPPRRAARCSGAVGGEGTPGRLHIAWLLVRPDETVPFRGLPSGAAQAGLCG